VDCIRYKSKNKMAEIEVLLPKMGESVAEATIIKWLKNEGEKIDAEESLLEIATDKVDSEVPAPSSGVLVKKLFNEGDVAKVGDVIAIIGGEGDAPKTEAPVSAASVEVPSPKLIEEIMAPVNGSSHGESIPKSGSNGKFFSPLVRTIAEKEGVTLAELETISGSGLGGRVTKKDILGYIPNRGSQSIVAAPAKTETQSKPVVAQPSVGSSEPMKTIKPPVVHLMPGDEIEEMDRMRKIIAENMIMSKHTSAHVTSFVEADVTNIVVWRDKIKKQFEAKYGEKLTFTPIFIEAIVKAIKDFPNINISVDGYNIVKRKAINIGMAAALPSGNLIVPVIKNADEYNLVGLTKKVNDLANRARQNKLQADEIQGGTYTISNVGTFGNVMGTPVIPQPQVAILAVGAIRKKPAVIETPLGDTIGIRQMMFMSHSYDHRVVDGSLGGMFVKRVGEYIEAFDINREI
jgi:2-oxoglutarate dehydrogenase E2 component (dihydrolipoamide succinyltransferase)